VSYRDPGHREDRRWAIPLSYHDWQYIAWPKINEIVRYLNWPKLNNKGLSGWLFLENMQLYTLSIRCPVLHKLKINISPNTWCFKAGYILIV